MSELSKKVGHLAELIIKGETLHAMELFYADHIIMRENEDEPRTGKSACLEHEKRNLKHVKEMQATLLNQAIDTAKDVVFSEWEYVVTYQDERKLKLTEVSVQQWENGKVIEEKFYYKAIYAVS